MIYLNLGLLYAGQGRDEEAIDALRRALELNPKYYKAHYELASLLDRNGNLREAAREYEVASPDYLQAAEYHYRLGWVYFRLDNKDKARESLQRAITLGPGSFSAAKADELLQMMN
jgi:tetratricopeptide (TPR) repeat protein